MKQLIAILFLSVLLCSCSRLSSPSSHIEKQLDQLDSVILLRDIFLKEKLGSINLVSEEKTLYSPDDARQISINERLIGLYRGFQCDSILRYCHENLRLCTLHKDSYRLATTQLTLAHTLAKSGMHDEANVILRQIDQPSLQPPQLAFCYWVNSLIYSNKAYLTKDKNLAEEIFIPVADAYRDSLSTVLSEAGEHRFTILSDLYLKQGKNKELENLASRHLEQLSSGRMRDAASCWFYIAQSRLQQGDKDGFLDALIKSAKLDMQFSIKDHASLHLIAQELYLRGELQRSARYMQLCMEDAQYYNANLRSLQLGSTLPVVMDAFARNNKKHIASLRIVSGIASILLLLSLLSLFLLMRERNKLSRIREQLQSANQRLNRINDELVESNYIKENYVARFIQQNSDYIYQTHDHLSRIGKAIRTGKTDEALALCSLPEYDEEQLADFYEAFDSAFLSIFPDFIKEYNSLLKDEYKYPTEQFEGPKATLTSELRVYALIRLGFNDSPTLANMLRYSVNSIYNIRSKAKSKACVAKEDFEEKVKEIGAVSE